MSNEAKEHYDTAVIFMTKATELSGNSDNLEEAYNLAFMADVMIGMANFAVANPLICAGIPETRDEDESTVPQQHPLAQVQNPPPGGVWGG